MEERIANHLLQQASFGVGANPITFASYEGT